MPAIYRRSALAMIDRLLHTGERSIVSILTVVPVQEVSESELRQFDPELSSLFSLNRQDQLDRARQCVTCN
jgi:molybdopterin-guanine dinucleotide biosynthesis protein A